MSGARHREQGGRRTESLKSKGSEGSSGGGFGLPADEPAILRGQASAREMLRALRQEEETARRTGELEHPGRDLLLAVGDSWFAYWPHGDILDGLQARHGWHVRNHSRGGWSLCEMLYDKAWHLADTPPSPLPAPDGTAVRDFARTLQSLPAAERERLRAVLVSGGGNDVAGGSDPAHAAPAVLRLVRPRDGGALLDEAALADLIDTRLRALLATLLATIAQLCTDILGRVPPIVVHGYAHPVPDGRGAFGRGWLKPALVERGYDQLEDRSAVMAALIDRLNDMQRDLIASNAPFATARHLDLRPLLRNDARYREDWQNELHPTIGPGFDRLAARFDEFCRTL